MAEELAACAAICTEHRAILMTDVSGLFTENEKRAVKAAPLPPGCTQHAAQHLNQFLQVQWLRDKAIHAAYLWRFIAPVIRRGGYQPPAKQCN